MAFENPFKKKNKKANNEELPQDMKELAGDESGLENKDAAPSAISLTRDDESNEFARPDTSFLSGGGYDSNQASHFDDEMSKSMENELDSMFSTFNLDAGSESGSSTEDMLKKLMGAAGGMLGENMDAAKVGAMESSEDSPNDVSEEDLSSLNDMFKMMGSDEDLQKALDGKMSEGISFSENLFESDLDGVDQNSLDYMINAALEKDRASEEKLDINDDMMDFVNETTIYDEDLGSIEVKPYVERKKREPLIVKKMSGMSFRTLSIIAGAMGALIIAVVAITVSIAMKTSVISRVEDKPNGVIISQPRGAINNANYIYISKGLMFKNEPLVLQKMLVDSLNTVFYFNKAIDARNYNITLIDDKDKLYALDLTFLQYDLHTAESESTILRFEPLDISVSYFNLRISDPKSGEVVEFEFALNSKILQPEVKYVGKTTDLMANSPGISVYIDNLTLSSSGSTLNYSMRWNDDSQMLQLGVKTNNIPVELYEDMRTVMPTKKQPNQYIFNDDKIIVGRMDFDPIRNLDSSITIQFTDLYKKYTLNTQINAEKLFENDESSETTIQINEYKLILEAAGEQKDKIILVLHTEASNLYAVSGMSQVYDNRVETNMDVKLRIERAPGVEVVLDGKSYTGHEGTDIVFDASSYTDLIRGVPYDKYTFEIQNVYIKCQDLTFDYDLKKARNAQEPLRKSSTASLVDSFEKRLAYKSGEISLDDIEGFDNPLLLDEKNMKTYNPVHGSDAIYAAQVITSSVTGDVVHAVLQEYWRGNVNGIEKNEYYTHKVVAQAREVGWVIISDVIIR